MTDEPRIWIRVDTRGARTRAIGPTRGIAPAVERRWRLRAIRAREEVRQAHEAGVLPHGRWWEAGPPDVSASALPVQVVGEPGAVDAVLMGLPANSGAKARPWMVDPDSAMVRVDGAPHLPGEGDADQDLRFGPFGPVACALRAAVLGEDGAGTVHDALQVAAAWCGQAQGDPAADLAAALCPPAFDATPVVVVYDPGLEDLARWWSRSLSAITCKPAADGPSHVPRGLACSSAPLGDEAQLQRALYADPPPWVVFLSRDDASVDMVDVRTASRNLVLRAGHPALDVRVVDARPETLLPAAWVALEASLAVAVAVGVEPLTLIPGEDLRAQLDSGGGGTT